MLEQYPFSTIDCTQEFSGIMFLLTSPTKWTSIEEVFIAAVTGVASHLFVFIHGEHHMRAPMIFRLYIALFSTLLYVEVVVKNEEVSDGAKEAVKIFTVYILSLLTSIAIYRKFFHRLRHFPGPSMASITKLWQTTKTLDSQNHILLDNLYEKYGDFVRTGKILKLSAQAACCLIRSKVPLRSQCLHLKSSGRSTVLPISATKQSGTIFFYH